MTIFKGAHLLGVLIAAACLGSACSELMPTSTASPKPTSTPTALPAGAEVPMPDGFPTDFPIYPGSRLTQAGKFNSNTSTNWGMEWQTRDSTAKVQSFFVARLAQGDWSLVASSGAANAFSATFRRKSDARTHGTLSAAVNGGITRISVVLTTSP